MEDGAKLHLKEWLVAQIESGRFEGLSWEDEDRTMFRIPWKHAAKKDYKQTEDAALFKSFTVHLVQVVHSTGSSSFLQKAWAVYKGKYREGRDKADPTMWKTRLRCALNKSSDFQEVPERNQLDITEPYKVYQIQPDTSSAKPAVCPQTNYQVLKQVKQSPRSPAYLDNQPHFHKESFEYKEEKSCSDPLREHKYYETTEKTIQNPAPSPMNFLSPILNISDFRMQVRLQYQGNTVTKVTTWSPDGCFILQGRVPLGNERIYGPCSAQQLSFPSPASVSLPSGMAEAMNRLLSHLERGVLLWVAPDGVFIKRFCQGRVYWSGPMAQHSDQPNKLEREKTFKLLDIPMFLNALQKHVQGRGSTPSYEIELCFGEEYPDPNVPKTRKLIMAQVVPLFAVELLQRFNLGQKEEQTSFLTSNSEGNMTLED